MTPPMPASAAPRQNTMLNRRDAGMPTARAICMSSTLARIITPSRVFSSSSHNPSASTTLPATTASR